MTRNVAALAFSCAVCISLSIPWDPALAQNASRAFGYIPTPVNELKAYSTTRRYRSFLPVRIDLSSRFPTPGNQLQMNSCVGWAVGYAARSYYVVSYEAGLRNSKQHIPSPGYIYQRIREKDNCQSGSYLPDAFKVLRQGALSLAQYPYSNNCSVPSARQVSKADDFKIKGWKRIDSTQIDDVKGQLAQGHPVIFGLQVDLNFEQLRPNQTYSQSTANRFYNHAVTAVGYDDKRQAIKFINSWGTKWADNGFGWISYSLFASNVKEAYVLQVSNRIPVPDKRPIIVQPADPEPESLVQILPDYAPPDREEQTIEPKKDLDIESAEPQIEKDEAETETELVIEIVPTSPLPESENQPTDREKLVETSPVEPEPNEKTEETLPVVESDPRDLPITEDNCSQLVWRRLVGHVEISGFVGTQEAHDKLSEEYLGGYKLDVEIRPWPQCEVLMTLGDRINSHDAPTLKLDGSNATLLTGDRLSLELKTPSKPSYLYLSYIQADGSVVHLYQPTGEVPVPARSATVFRFGDGAAGRAKYTVTSPYGREMFIALASASPLFDKRLPGNQIERDYLSALRKALIYKADPNLPDREVTASFLGLETKER